MTELAPGGLVPTEADRLDQAEQSVRDYCGWHIAPPRTDTVTFSDVASRRLMLPSLWVTAVVSVTVDGSLTDAGGYVVHRAGWISRTGWGWWTADEIEVTFTHGYDEAPASVTRAVQALAQGDIGNSGVLKQKTIGPFTEVYGLPADLLAGLGAYRIVPVS